MREMAWLLRGQRLALFVCCVSCVPSFFSASSRSHTKTPRRGTAQQDGKASVRSALLLLRSFSAVGFATQVTLCDPRPFLPLSLACFSRCCCCSFFSFGSGCAMTQNKRERERRKKNAS